MARTTAPPGGRTRGRRGGRTYTGFRVWSSLGEWIVAVFAVEYLAPWLVAFLVLPTIGQLMHAGWAGFWWSWPLAFGLILAGGPLGLALEPYARRQARQPRPTLANGEHTATPEEWAARGRRWLAAPKVLGGLGILTYHEAQRRGLIGRWRVAYAVAGAFTSLAVTLRAGLIHALVWPLYQDAAGWHWQWPMDTNTWWFVLYTCGAGLMCAALNIRNLQAVKGGGEEEDAPTSGTDLQDLFKAEGPVKPKPSSRKVIGDGAAVEVELHHPGDTTETIQAGLPKLVSTIGRLPREGHLVVPGDHPEDTRVTIVQRELLGESEAWPGPQHPGEYADVPVVIGRAQDGMPAELVRFAATKGVTPRAKDPQVQRIRRKDWDTSNSLDMGMTGSGKTENGLNEDAELMTRIGVVLWRSDTAKAGQTANDIRPAIDWLATSPEETYRMIVALGEYVEWASELMGRHGYRRWSRKVWDTLGIPALLVRLEELNNVVDVLGKHVLRRVEQVRSVGASIAASSARADATNLPTGFRAQLGIGICFGVKDASDAQFCLSEYTLLAGADPGRWLNVQQGKCYVEAHHVDQSRWPIPVRTWAPIDPLDLRRHTARYAPHMVEMPTQWAERSAERKDAKGNPLPGAGAFYLNRSRVNMSEWVERNGMLVPAREGSYMTAARESVALRELPPPTQPLRVVDLDAATPATRVPEPAADLDDDDPNDPLIRQLDQEENAAVIRQSTDPEIASEIAAAHNRAAEIDSIDPDSIRPEDDLPLGDQLPSRDMSTPEARNAALAQVFRDLFADRSEDFIDVTSRDLIDMWAETGALNALPGGRGSNRRNALSGRLLRLQEDGHVSLLEEGRGRRPAVYRINRTVLGPAVDSEPDDDDDEE